MTSGEANAAHMLAQEESLSSSEHWRSQGSVTNKYTSYATHTLSISEEINLLSGTSCTFNFFLWNSQTISTCTASRWLWRSQLLLPFLLFSPSMTCTWVPVFFHCRTLRYLFPGSTFDINHHLKVSIGQGNRSSLLHWQGKKRTARVLDLWWWGPLLVLFWFICNRRF